MSEAEAYQLAICCGVPVDAFVGAAQTVKSVVPTDTSPEAVTSALLESKLCPADLKSRVVVIIGGEHRDVGLALWLGLWGLASRPLDIVISNKLLRSEAAVNAALRAPEAAKPNDKSGTVFVSTLPLENHTLVVTKPSDSELPDEAASTPAVNVVLSLSDNPLSDVAPRQISQIRFMRDLVLDLPSSGIAAANALAAIVGLRHRDSAQLRSCVISSWDQDASGLRRAGTMLRRELLASVFPAVTAKPVPETVVEYNKAAGLDIHEVLTRLGTHAKNERYHCPRPQNHTHGDANASARIVGNTLRCGRCDPEGLDPLRLTMSVLEISPDDAVNLLLHTSGELRANPYAAEKAELEAAAPERI